MTNVHVLFVIKKKQLRKIHLLLERKLAVVRARHVVSHFFQNNSIAIRKQSSNDKIIEIRYSTFCVVIAIPMHDVLIQMFPEGLLRQTLVVALLVVFLL